MQNTTLCPNCTSGDIDWTKRREDYRTHLVEFDGTCLTCGVDLDGIAAPGYPVRVINTHPPEEQEIETKEEVPA